MNRLARLIWGTDFDPAVRPLVLSSFGGTLAGSSVWTFVGIWAIKHLGASQSALSIGFLVGAIASISSGWLGGHVSDHVGRRKVMLVGWAGQVLAPLGLLASGQHVIVGLAALTVFSIFGSVFSAAQYAMVADLLPPERREAGYAAVRVAQNLGVVFGPAVGGLLLLGNSWARLFIGVFVLGSCAFALGYRLLPSRGLYAPDGVPERNSFGVVRRDRAFLLFIASALLASMTYLTFESLLPISLTTSHGIPPSDWGFLVIINGAIVAFGQLRLTKAVAHISPAVKLAAAMPLMGFPFLFLQVDDSVGVVAVLMTIFVLGEMLWVPTSQAVASRLAPPDLRGAYMGVYGGASQAAWALTPFAGLQTRAAFGDSAMWVGVAAVSLVAGAVGAFAARSHYAMPSPRIESPPATPGAVGP
ncbi:MAG TPA: MFS transporter [Gaiellaceae bacterium]